MSNDSCLPGLLDERLVHCLVRSLDICRYTTVATCFIWRGVYWLIQFNISPVPPPCCACRESLSRQIARVCPIALPVFVVMSDPTQQMVLRCMSPAGFCLSCFFTWFHYIWRSFAAEAIDTVEVV
jgi:hypothetical protein